MTGVSHTCIFSTAIFFGDFFCNVRSPLQIEKNIELVKMFFWYYVKKTIILIVQVCLENSCISSAKS